MNGVSLGHLRAIHTKDPKEVRPRIKLAAVDSEKREFDPVNFARHYNEHPSGIEAIALVRTLNFNMGCALKYVMRRHGKEYERSLNSAEYYLRDQHESGNVMVQNYVIFRLLDDYRHYEPVPQVATFYRVFSSYLNHPTNQNFEMLMGSLGRIIESKL